MDAGESGIPFMEMRWSSCWSRQSWSARGNVVILIAPRRVSSTPANAYILASRFRKMVDVDFLEGPALCWLAHAQTTHDLFCSVRTRGSQLKPQFICNRWSSGTAVQFWLTFTPLYFHRRIWSSCTCSICFCNPFFLDRVHLMPAVRLITKLHPVCAIYLSRYNRCQTSNNTKIYKEPKRIFRRKRSIQRRPC